MLLLMQRAQHSTVHRPLLLLSPSWQEVNTVHQDCNFAAPEVLPLLLPAMTQLLYTATAARNCYVYCLRTCNQEAHRSASRRLRTLCKHCLSKMVCQTMVLTQNVSMADGSQPTGSHQPAAAELYHLPYHSAARLGQALDLRA